MTLTRKELVLKQYHWDDANKNSLFYGLPTRRSFDRYNGNQVLFVINHYAGNHHNVGLSDLLWIESALSVFLPLSCISEIGVSKWIEENMLMRK